MKNTKLEEEIWEILAVYAAATISFVSGRITPDQRHQSNDEAVKALANLIQDEKRRAKIDELQGAKDKSETHLESDGRTERRAYLENRLAQLKKGVE